MRRNRGHGEHRLGAIGMLVAAMAALVLVTGCTPRASIETLTIGAEPVTTTYCFKPYDLVRLALMLREANVDPAGGPIVHASLSTGQEFDMTADGTESSAIYDETLLQSAGCITITWTALRAPADGPLTFTVGNNGYW